MARAASSDRNFYDRCYLNAHDRSGEVFLITGLGTYPNLGVRDAFATVRVERSSSTRCGSPTPSTRGRSSSRSGRYRIEVVEPLQEAAAHLRARRTSAST